MKSAIELAMERSGGGKKLTDEQKREIADIRTKAKARIAEEEIMFRQKTGGVERGQGFEALKEGLAREIQKIEEKMEAAIERVKERG